MERFKNAVEDLIGIQLTDEETILLYTKYKYKGSKLPIFIYSILCIYILVMLMMYEMRPETLKL